MKLIEYPDRELMMMNLADRLSSELTNTFPSPNLPVRAALRTASTAASTSSSSITVSILTLGRNSTLYSAPR